MVSQHHPYRTLFVSCIASTYTLTSSPSALRLALKITRERGDMNIAQDNHQPCLLQTRASAATPHSLCRRRVRMGPIIHREADVTACSGLRAYTTLAGLPARPARRRPRFTRLRLIDV